MMSKVTRRAIYWVLLATTLAGLVSTVVFSNASNAFFDRHASVFWHIIGVAVVMLLAWCAVFVRDEHRLVRLFLIIMAFVVGFYASLPAL